MQAVRRAVAAAAAAGAAAWPARGGGARWWSPWQQLHARMAASAPQPPPPVLAVLGCTGVGKTKLSLALAARVGGELINADSLQVYHGLDIVTNKATAAEQAQARHHLLGTVPPTAAYNVLQFRDAALAAIEDIRARGKVPILVGGTAYFMESVLFHRLADETASQMDVPAAVLAAARVQLDALAQSDLSLHEQLSRVDPVRAERLHPNDLRKIQRSLAVFRQYGATHSEVMAVQAEQGSLHRLRHHRCFCFWIDCDLDVLAPRLDARVDAMVEQGLFAEVRAFRAMLRDSMPPVLCSPPPAEALGDDGEAEAGEKRTAAALPNAALSGAAKPAVTPKLNFERGVLQAIGFKELWPFLEAEQAAADDGAGAGAGAAQGPEALAALRAEGLEAMKAATRRYSRKQTAWITNRLHQAVEGFHLYRYDASRLEEWDQTVLGPALAHADAILAGSPQPGLDLPRDGGGPKQQWGKHHCDKCDKTLNGEHEWEQHLASKRHRNKKKRPSPDEIAALIAQKRARTAHEAEAAS